MFGSRLAQTLVVFACLFGAATSASADGSARSFEPIVDTADSAPAHAVATSERVELSEFRDAVATSEPPVYSDAFAKPGQPVYVKTSTGAFSARKRGALGQISPSTNTSADTSSSVRNSSTASR